MLTILELACQSGIHNWIPTTRVEYNSDVGCQMLVTTEFCFWCGKMSGHYKREVIV